MMRYLPLLGLLLLASACTRHHYYAPGTVTIPSVNHKGDWSVEAGLNDATGSAGWQCAGVYSPFPHALVNLSAQRLSGQHEEYIGSVDEIYQHSGSGYLYEGGVGYYLPASPGNTFNFLVQYGMGGSEHQYDLDRTASLRFSRWSATAGGITRGKLAHLGLGLRLSYLDFQSARIQIDVPESEQSLIRNILDANPLLIPELGIKTGVHVGPIDINCQLNFGLSRKNKQFGFADNTVGLSVAFSPR
jgi:hypothetical protein